MHEQHRSGMVTGLAHVGIAAHDLAYLLGALRQLGFDVVRREELRGQGAISNIVEAGGVQLELLESTDPEGNVGRFLARRGPGLHHLCLEVDDIDRAMAAADAAGLRLLDRTPSRDSDGLRAFVHPGSVGGVLVGLVQPHQTPPGTAEGAEPQP